MLHLEFFVVVVSFFISRYIPEFTITLSQSERLWLQVIHMNLSTADATQFTQKCRDQTEKLELYDCKYVLFLSTTIRKYSSFNRKR